MWSEVQLKIKSVVKSVYLTTDGGLWDIKEQLHRGGLIMESVDMHIHDIFVYELCVYSSFH